MRGLAKAGAVVGLLLATWGSGSGAAAQQCNMGLAAELPVVMDGNQPLVRVSINGQPVLALLDTGAFKTMIWRGAAERLGLKLVPVEGMKLVGVGGRQNAYKTRVQELKLGQAALKDAPLLVGGQERPLGGREEIALILGQDLLSRGDLEIDLKGKVVRLYKTENCKNKPLVYWTEYYNLVDIESPPGESRPISIDVLVNGRKVRADLDTGATTSVITTAAARQAGVTTDEATAAGASSGIGAKTVSNWIGRFKTVQIGDQTMKNAPLRIADLFRHGSEAETGTRISASPVPIEMLLGADFLLSHRVLVAYSQNKVYFSYNGGPIFQTRNPRAQELGPPGEAKPQAPAAAAKP
jgi:predicted aspartyl protease